MKCDIVVHTLNPARNLKSNTNFWQFNFVGTLQASIFWFIVLCALMFQSFLPDVDLNSNCFWIKSWYLSRFEERNFCTDLKNISNFFNPGQFTQFLVSSPSSLAKVLMLKFPFELLACIFTSFSHCLSKQSLESDCRRLACKTLTRSVIKSSTEIESSFVCSALSWSSRYPNL